MATTFSSYGRSFHGCWTCRLRKKKCDENRPVCSLCVSLELQCDGYGNKPIWMDNGPLQREQSLLLKRIVSQTNAKKRKQRMLRPNSPVPNIGLDMDIVYEETSSASEAPSNSSSEEHPFNLAGVKAAGLRDEVRFCAWDMDLNLLGQEILSEDQEGDFSAEWFTNNSSWEADAYVDNNFSGAHDSMLPEPSAVPHNSEATPTPTPNASTRKITGKSALPPEGMLLEAIASSRSTTQWKLSDYSTPPHSLGASKVVEEYVTLPTYLKESHQSRTMEDELFLHYLDEVFYIQYPFYNSSNKQLRLWIFSYLRRVKSVYYATLALSKQHMQSTIEMSLQSTQSNKSNYYDMALQEMDCSLRGCSGLSETARLARSVEGITCILQILFGDLFAGGAGHWRPHLQRAATLISPLVQTRVESSPGSTGVSFVNEIEAKVLLGCFISFDIMGCASIRSQPSSDLDYKHILETFEIDLRSLFGCANGVIVLLFEIVLLDSWKKNVERTRQLSVVELVKRGAKIEERLLQKSWDSEGTNSSKSNTLECYSSTSSTSQAEITNIFALSARIYLHVVLSGAYPELPEIAESVSKIITAFKNLADPRLVQKLVWPFCIAGCLALDEQQSFFRNLITNAGIAPSSSGTCLQAFRIIEECWEMRRVCSFNCDWVCVMNKLGRNILLL